MDALDSVLHVASVRGAIAATFNASEPWGITLDAAPAAAFHAVTDGTAWLSVDGQPDFRLMPGDVVLLPRGPAHVLASGLDATTYPFQRIAAEQGLVPGGEVNFGDGVMQTRILCASYRQQHALYLPVLSLLPDVVHVPSGLADTALQRTLRLLADELSASRPGSSSVLNRVVDILLVQLLRAWLATDQDRPPSWLGAMNDPVAGPALAALHTAPERAWTTADLAAEAGVSTATLARRFQASVGDSPAAYLAQWRMDLAAQRLRESEDTVAAIARSVGYTSEYAFNRAFARAKGSPPGRFRLGSRSEIASCVHADP